MLIFVVVVGKDCGAGNVEQKAVHVVKSSNICDHRSSLFNFPEAVRRVKGTGLQAFNPLQLLQNEVGNGNFCFPGGALKSQLFFI